MAINPFTMKGAPFPMTGPGKGPNIVSDKEVSSDTIDTEKYGEVPVIASDMTTGRSGYLEGVELKPVRRKKTRAQHRLDKTQVKGEESVEDGNYAKANRLQRRKQRLIKKVARQEGKEKKKYARKDKSFYRKRS